MPQSNIDPTKEGRRPGYRNQISDGTTNRGESLSLGVALLALVLVDVVLQWKTPPICAQVKRRKELNPFWMRGAATA